MANRLSGKILYFDQFGTDVTLAANSLPFIVRKIRLRSVAAGDLFQLEDLSGNVFFMMHQATAAGVSEVDFGRDGYNFGNSGVVIDVSDCTGLAATDGTDAVWIYLV